jgi:hypothetical protein
LDPSWTKRFGVGRAGKSPADIETSAHERGAVARGAVDGEVKELLTLSDKKQTRVFEPKLAKCQEQAARREIHPASVTSRMLVPGAGAVRTAATPTELTNDQGDAGGGGETRSRSEYGPAGWGWQLQRSFAATWRLWER